MLSGMRSTGASSTPSSMAISATKEILLHRDPQSCDLSPRRLGWHTILSCIQKAIFICYNIQRKHAKPDNVGPGPVIGTRSVELKY